MVLYPLDCRDKWCVGVVALPDAHLLLNIVEAMLNAGLNSRVEFSWLNESAGPALGVGPSLSPQ